MEVSGKKLGILVAAGPESPNFDRALQLAEAALAQKVEVYLYCIDQAVRGLNRAETQRLRERGLKLFGCAFSAQKLGLALDAPAVYGGLAILSDIIGRTDRFVGFGEGERDGIVSGRASEVS
jgi:hypothetical protein